MINGVMHIVAAVLFAVISFGDGMNMVWLAIAGVYLVTGIINLVAHSVKVKRMEKAAKKAEQTKSEVAASAASSDKETTVTGE